jgi:hypothetical protein
VAVLLTDCVLSCIPFTTNSNIYSGGIRIAAGVLRTETPDDYTPDEALGVEIIDKLMPASSGMGSGSFDAASNSDNAGGGNGAAPGFTAMTDANFPGELV